MKVQKYKCTLCGWVYDPEEHDGILFEDLPPEWTCPLCGAGKELFVVVGEE